MLKTKLSLLLTDSHHPSENTWNVFVTHYNEILIGALEKLVSCFTYDAFSLEAYSDVDLMPMLRLAKHLYLKWCEFQWALTQLTEWQWIKVMSCLSLPWLRSYSLKTKFCLMLPSLWGPKVYQPNPDGVTFFQWTEAPQRNNEPQFPFHIYWKAYKLFRSLLGCCDSLQVPVRSASTEAPITVSTSLLNTRGNFNCQRKEGALTIAQASKQKKASPSLFGIFAAIVTCTDKWR